MSIEKAIETLEIVNKAISKVKMEEGARGEGYYVFSLGFHHVEINDRDIAKWMPETMARRICHGLIEMTI